MSFLIDTDTASAHLRNNRAVTSRFLQYTGRLYISTVSLKHLCDYLVDADGIHSALRRAPSHGAGKVQFLAQVTTFSTRSAQGRFVLRR